MKSSISFGQTANVVRPESKEMPKAQASNLIVGMIERHHEKANHSGWALTKSKRFKFEKQNWLSHAYFNQVLSLPGEGIEHSLLDVMQKIKLDLCPSLGETHPYAYDAYRNVIFTQPVEHDFESEEKVEDADISLN